MISQLHNLLKLYSANSDGIYGDLSGIPKDQSTEIELRERVAADRYDNYLDALSCSHSISVMDHEVDLFLAKIPQGGLILDVGGCWGWHWRRLSETRPDVGVLVIDFVRLNLPHAQKLLGDLVGHQIALMQADATALPFTVNESFSGFDGVWTVQTFQHIPDFEKAVSEACRVLKKGGVFANYSLNIQPPIRWLKCLLGRDYLTKGWAKGMFWLSRASQEQKACIEDVFDNVVYERWCEILYSPELHFIVPGKVGSMLGKFDALLSNNVGFLGWFARQRSFHCEKR
jgi:ubiquinone/menaquinone biosynthesis C-methylase UbiE